MVCRTTFTRRGAVVEVISPSSAVAAPKSSWIERSRSPAAPAETGIDKLARVGAQGSVALEENVMVTLNDARRVIAAAEKKARAIGQPMNVAVVDAGGNLVSHVRMDGAWIGSIDISINKAFTARAFDLSTEVLGKNSQPGQQFSGYTRQITGVL
jgi:hypothetical protein